MKIVQVHHFVHYIFLPKWPHRSPWPKLSFPTLIWHVKTFKLSLHVGTKWQKKMKIHIIYKFPNYEPKVGVSTYIWDQLLHEYTVILLSYNGWNESLFFRNCSLHLSRRSWSNSVISITIQILRLNRDQTIQVRGPYICTKPVTLECLVVMGSSSSSSCNSSSSSSSSSSSLLCVPHTYTIFK